MGVLGPCGQHECLREFLFMYAIFLPIFFRVGLTPLLLLASDVAACGASNEIAVIDVRR